MEQGTGNDTACAGNDIAGIWDTLRRHLNSVFSGDVKTYEETAGADLSLYEMKPLMKAGRLSA